MMDRDDLTAAVAAIRKVTDIHTPLTQRRARWLGQIGTGAMRGLIPRHSSVQFLRPSHGTGRTTPSRPAGSDPGTAGVMESARAGKPHHEATGRKGAARDA